ncbi:MAG: signal recognition particle protein [Puniceicoccales bacterium]|jgi:signal recognition particle subunit SRP54|nr:signal recognition particle protein [Puniceicoccales bacterium]
MFEVITDKMSQAIRAMRGLNKISEANVADALVRVKTALLASDVHYKVVKEFIANVQAKCLGQKVVVGATPGQQLIHGIHSELVALLGGESPNFFALKPLRILMVGLHGSGKTTTTIKLAAMLQKKGYHPAVIACDVYRPAAIDQLEQLAQQASLPFYGDREEKRAVSIASSGLAWAKEHSADAILWDTAGRLQIDDVLIQELKDMRSAIQPQEILLVADSALGQEAVNVAKHFHEALTLTGIVLTKLDGDARGGAAVSMKSVTQVPIRFMGTGEKISDLEIFHADRMAQRILGMGDVISLVEKAQEVVDQQEAERLAEKMKHATFTLDDFLQQMRKIQNMGSVSSLLQHLPGMNSMSSEDADKRFKRVGAVVSSMTLKERRHPDIIHGQRRVRIAKGSGTTLADVNSLLKQFHYMKQMMKKMKNTHGRKELQQMMAQMGGGMTGDSLHF